MGKRHSESRSKFRFGVVTALAKEFAAVKAVLDEPRNLEIDGDPNDYIKGTIPASDGSGATHVVVTLLKKMGNNSAATAASHLLRSFPEVDDVLMVGIAGGMPHPTDADKHVRLGDVVVSNEYGVLQWDNVKLTPKGDQIRDTSQSPSASLIGKCKLLEAGRLEGIRPWEELIARGTHLEGSMRPGDSTDVLYDSSDPPAPIRHPEDPYRRMHQPKIHFGRIGSANILLKDAQTRDILRDEFGVRATEMEGSGIADGTWTAKQSYILIRGISDYCDQAKNDIWQGYAAVAAAAYMRALIASFPARPDPDNDILTTYRESLLSEHNQPPGLFIEYISDLDTIFVELEIGQLGAKFSHEQAKVTGLTLRELMELDTGEDHKPRWVVLGDPGAGKSTLARHLVWKLAGNSLDPLPVYYELSSLAADPFNHPFDRAEKLLQGSRGIEAGKGLSDLLFKQANDEKESIWLFLDGLDEVNASQRHLVNSYLTQWAAQLSNVAIAVFSRPVGYQQPGSEFVNQARIQKLSYEKQKQLLSKWLDDEDRAVDVLRDLQNRPGLRDACQVPLILSLLAFSVKEGTEVPHKKLELYQIAIRTLLRRGQSTLDNQGVKDPDSAYIILTELCLKLQESDSYAWTLAELIQTATGLMAEKDTRRKRPNASDLLQNGTWSTPRDFLLDVAVKSGVLADQDPTSRSPSEKEKRGWCFLHRQFRELLAAEALRSRGDEAILDRAKSLTSEEIPRWAEVLGFACELAKASERLDILKAIGEISGELALRVLPEVEGIDHVEALALLLGNEQWDGDFLVGLLNRWTQQGGLNIGQARGWLWQQIAPDRSTLELSYLHYALEVLDGKVDRKVFFARCKRWPEGGPPKPKLVEIPAGTFVIGSPKDESHRSESEGPQREITVPSFQLGATAVTNDEYEAFDPSHSWETFNGRLSSTEKQQHPVVGIRWWEARLYCAWLDCRLPTEAEWEYACRAGAPSRYYSGDTDRDLARVGWYSKNTRDHTHPVGQKVPNKLGLFDMHGNVLEWCEDDWYENYEETPSDCLALARIHHPRSNMRVSRGGSWFDDPRDCRSASRHGFLSGHHTFSLGFRVSRNKIT